MFFVTLRKNYKTSITKQFKFLNSHCSIVCGSFLWLMAKSNLKMIKFSSSVKLNEIHTVDSPFNEYPKNIIFFQGGLNIGGETAEKFRENGNIVMLIGGW